MAMNCELNCFTHEAMDKMAEDEHACCQDKDESKDTNCMEHMSGVCFHENIQDKYSQLHLKSIPLFYISSSLELNNGLPRDIRYLPNIPDQYQKFKSQISLFLLKDQFLI